MDPAVAVIEEALALREPVMNEIAAGKSEIKTWYEGGVVFITGGSGFLGKHLIEKLLRSCSIKKIYVLSRGKKGQTVTERWNDIIKDPVFDLLRGKDPTFSDKIHPIEGDVTEIRLGINDDDWRTVTAEVDVIFHAAATTRFDESLKRATCVNVRGTLEVCKLSKECRNLRSLVHVSTAFAHATRKNINKDVLEQFYPSSILPEDLIKMTEEIEDNELLEITDELLNEWPNTYTFTKAVAEEVIRTHGNALPVNIVRPPVVISSYYEPTPGWLDTSTIYGPSGIILGIGLGVTHVLYNKKDVMLACAPVDYVTNAIIAAGWDAGTRTHATQATIYTISNIKCGYHWGKISAHMNSDAFRKLSTPKAIWWCFAYETDNIILFWLMTWLLHFIPAYIADAACTLFRIKMPRGIPSFVKIYTKIYKTTKYFSYFLTNEFNFKDDNTERLISRLCPQDRVIFNFDVNTINWPQMFTVWCAGLRKFIIKDGLKNSLSAYKRQKRLRYVNYAILAVYCYVIYKILRLFMAGVMYFI